jgi:hypothetical protein
MSRSEYDLVSNPLARYSGEFYKDKRASLIAFGRGQSGRVAFLRLPKATVQVGSIQEGVQEELVGYFLFPSFAYSGNKNIFLLQIATLHILDEVSTSSSNIISNSRWHPSSYGRIIY